MSQEGDPKVVRLVHEQKPYEETGETTALDIIEALDDLRAQAARGALRTVAIVAVGSDGTRHKTRWAGQSIDIAGMAGALAILQADIIASRR